MRLVGEYNDLMNKSLVNIQSVGLRENYKIIGLICFGLAKAIASAKNSHLQ